MKNLFLVTIFSVLMLMLNVSTLMATTIQIDIEGQLYVSTDTNNYLSSYGVETGSLFNMSIKYTLNEQYSNTASENFAWYPYSPTIEVKTTIDSSYVIESQYASAIVYNNTNYYSDVVDRLWVEVDQNHLDNDFGISGLNMVAWFQNTDTDIIDTALEMPGYDELISLFDNNKSFIRFKTGGTGTEFNIYGYMDSYNISQYETSPVPEPSTILLLSLGSIIFGYRKKMVG